MKGRKTFLKGSLWGTTLGGRFCFPCLTGEPTGALRGRVTCSRSSSWVRGEAWIRTTLTTVAMVRVATPRSELEGYTELKDPCLKSRVTFWPNLLSGVSQNVMCTQITRGLFIWKF